LRAYMNTPHVAKLLGVNIQTVREYIRSGELPAARVGRRYVIARDDVDRFIEKRKDARTGKDIGLTEKGRETVEKVKQNSKRVLEYLKDCPGADTEELAEALGMEPEDTRRALLKLEGGQMAYCKADSQNTDRNKDPWYPGSSAGSGGQPPR
jgi:excisionase family DNA binding protein